MLVNSGPGLPFSRNISTEIYPAVEKTTTEYNILHMKLLTELIILSDITAREGGYRLFTKSWNCNILLCWEYNLVFNNNEVPSFFYHNVLSMEQCTL